MRLRAMSVLAALLLIAFASPSFAGDIKFPPLTGRVIDQAQVLTPDDAQTLTDRLAAQEQKTGQQVVVAIVGSLQGQTIEDYGYQLGRFWGIGQKDKNTGAILLVAPKEHKVRIEVGYGLEGTLTDARCSDIVDEIILPAFKKGDMQAGIVAGTQAILNVLNGRDIAAADATAESAPQVYDNAAVHHSFPPLFILAIFFFLIISRMFIRPSLFGYGLLGGMMGSSWGGGGSGMSFSGGGGSFGGGGASGSW